MMTMTIPSYEQQQHKRANKGTTNKAMNTKERTRTNERSRNKRKEQTIQTYEGMMNKGERMSDQATIGRNKRYERTKEQ
jgi:hypothetical protein